MNERNARASCFFQDCNALDLIKKILFGQSCMRLFACSFDQTQKLTGKKHVICDKNL